MPVERPGLPPKLPVEDPAIAKLQAENRILQLQLMEKKISESSPSSPVAEDDDDALEQVDPDALAPEQLQLFSLRRQLRRERRCRLFLQKTLMREVQMLRVWMDHDRVRHREQLQRLMLRGEKLDNSIYSASSRSRAAQNDKPEEASGADVFSPTSPPPPDDDAGTQLIELNNANADSDDGSERPETAASPPPPPEEKHFYYKYSAPVKSESEGQTKAIIEQTASRAESRRKHLASFRQSNPNAVTAATNPPKDGSSHLRLRGSSTQGRDRQQEDPSLRSRMLNFANPNQIGKEILDSKKNKAWYLRHALCLAFLRTVPSSKEEDSADVPPTRTSPSSPPTSESRVSAFLGVNSASMQHAINEVTHMYFHLSGNAPVLTSGTRHRDFARLEDENNDPDLLKAFDISGVARSDSPTEYTKERRPQHARTSSISSSDYRDDELRISFHAPVIFNQIRELLMLSGDQFREALQHSTWRESLSPGKSGTSLIYFGDYVMKSLPDSDYNMLTTRYLPAYVKYCEQHPHSLLTRFYAIVTVKWLKSSDSKCYVLMQNVFTTRNYIYRIYDVKGSTVGRSAIQPGKEPPKTAFGALLLKDNDLPDTLLYCGPSQRKVLLEQLRLDLTFLESLSIVDYSMMIGVRGRVLSRDETLQADAAKAAEASKPEDVTCLRRCDGGILSLPIKNADHTSREEVYYLGVIDVLQEYNSTKKLENFAKGFYNDRTQISVIPPHEYAERLWRSIERISC